MGEPGPALNLARTLIANQPPLDAVTEAEATEWFRQYEEIHPFRDGNGRTGALLYLWLLGALDRPKLPPNLWDDPRRTAHSGYPDVRS